MRRRPLRVRVRPRPALAWGAWLAALALLAAPAAGQETRTEILRWAHPDPSEVAGFRVHVGVAPGRYERRIDVGLPRREAGHYVYELEVPRDADVYVAVSAYDAEGEESPPSNEARRPAPPSGEPPGGAARASSGSERGEAPEPLGTPGRPRAVEPRSP